MSFPAQCPSLLPWLLLLAVAGCAGPPGAPPESPFDSPLMRLPDEKGGVEDSAVLTTEGPESSSALASGHSLEAYRIQAAASNPGLRALYHDWRARAEGVARAGAWPEPRFTYVEYLRSVETRTGPQERSFALAQPVPGFGKPGLRASVEEERAAAAWMRFLAAQLAVDFEVRSAYADLYYLGRSIAVTRENLGLLVRLERVAREKFAAGAENHPDIIRLQVEIGRHEDRLESLEDARRPLQARLNALRSRPSGEVLPWPERLEEAAIDLESLDLTRLLETSNPELLALGREIEGAVLGERLAAREYLPDFTLGLQTISTGSALLPGTRDGGEDPWMVSVSMELPLWISTLRAGEREARERSRAARARREDASRRLRAEAELALYELRDARRRVELYGTTLVRKAEESLASTEAAFQADSADFLALIDAERALLEFQLSLERARADRLRAAARLDRLLGRFAPRAPVTESKRSRKWE